MAKDFGFEPSERDYYFASYSSRDKWSLDRTEEICRALHNKGVRIWYDRGLVVGKKWMTSICEHIEDSKMVLMFISSSLVYNAEGEDDSGVLTEYEIATKQKGKDVVPVFIDEIDDKRINNDFGVFYNVVMKKQGVTIPKSYTADQAADAIINRLKAYDTSLKNIKTNPLPKVDSTSVNWRALAIVAALMFMVAAVVCCTIIGMSMCSGDADTTGGDYEPPVYSDNNGNNNNSKNDNEHEEEEPEPVVETVKSPFADVQIGDIVEFGSYYVDSDSWQDPIEWRVLDIDRSNGTALLISDKGIDAKQFHEKNIHVIWKNSTLRDWLNDTFYNRAFSAEEQSFIVESRISTSDYDGTITYTQDNVFCLSTNEVREYFSSAEDRQAIPSYYADIRGAEVGKTTGNCCWWLRSSSMSGWADCIDYFGNILRDGAPVHFTSRAVRPAIYVTIEDQ